LNVDRLAAFEAGTEVTVELLKEMGMVPKSTKRVKILGDGDLTVSLNIIAHAFSRGAQDKITSAGGSFRVI
jgi:large subunit ribosomal protein L15